MTVKANFGFIQREMEFQDSEVVRFIKSEEGKSTSDDTVYKYAKGLEDYSEWLDENDREIFGVDFVDIQNYLSFLINNKGYADKTVYSKFVPVRLFYKHAKKLGEIEDNPVEEVDVTDYIKSPHNTRIQEQTGDKRIYLSKDEILTLVDNAPAPSFRNRLIILFMYYTGLRRSEVVNVKLDDIDRDSRTVTVEVKGGEEHTAVWHEKLDGLMTQWLDYGYRDSYPTADESSYLFVSNTTEKLSGNRINSIINEAAENASMQETLFEDANGRERKKIVSHTIRHSFAMNFIKDGGSFEALSNRLAHSSITTTEIYGEVEDERGIEEYNEVMQPIQTTDEIETDQCLLCGSEGNLEEHHISYEPEQVIDVCNDCHRTIHDTEQYQHLLPIDSECG